MPSTGAIAAGHAETAAAAAAVLAEGGNAFDAALAGMCVACVAEPALSSLGGGGFLTARPVAGRLAGKTLVYDFFAQTPKTRRPDGEADFRPVLADFGTAQQEFHIGMGSIATPGVVKGLFEAHADLCRMPMRRLVEPATALARGGVRIEPIQAYVIGVVASILKSRPESLALFASAERPGEIVGAGDVLRAPAFADTLEVLAIEGDGLFYRGEIAASIVRDCAERGGFLTRADLEGYRVERRAPLVVEALGATLQTNPPPSTGGILIAFALALLNEIDFSGVAFGGAAHIETLTRAMAMTNRARIDSRLHEAETGGVAETLLHPEFVAAYRAGVLGRPQAPRGTTHLSVIDAAGNAAALSLSNGEGSAYVVPGAGIMLNNMLGEEDINPHGFHRWPEDVRLASMMAPSLVLDRAGGITALGSGGSNRIRTAILQVLLNLRAFGRPLEDAVAAPRLHFENGTLRIEPGFADEAVERAASEADTVERWDALNMFFGGVHAVRRHADGGLEGAGDPRRGGVAL